MNRNKFCRQWGIDIPTSASTDHRYEFDVDFDISNSQQVVVEWNETAIGCGLFRVPRKATLGEVVIDVHKRLILLAMAHARLGASSTDGVKH